MLHNVSSRKMMSIYHFEKQWKTKLVAKAVVLWGIGLSYLWCGSAYTQMKEHNPIGLSYD